MKFNTQLKSSSVVFTTFLKINFPLRSGIQRKSYLKVDELRPAIETNTCKKIKYKNHNEGNHLSKGSLLQERDGPDKNQTKATRQRHFSFNDPLCWCWGDIRGPLSCPLYPFSPVRLVSGAVPLVLTSRFFSRPLIKP